ncbi:MAG: DEAD/DEAH box helicase [Spirochaetaceae bacterium]|jgi:ATP-dependent RNA helicase RhlB|nr:DEAD/DEAH box helicase [Spirochaetaceae bacterium]
MEFQSLPLDENLKRALAEAGYLNTMPVQEQVLERGLGGQDLYVQSQTGTGKTAAYLIIVFQRLLADPLLKGRKALIIVPTRELAVQVEEEARVLAKYLSFKIGSFYGGVGYGGQQQSLRNGADILIGTPGRVLDLNSNGKMNLMDIAFLVIDEADRMFDMGFYPDLRRLIKVVSDIDKRQTMLFSATLNVYVKNLAFEYTKEPVEIEIEPEHITVEEIDQKLYHVPSEKKFALLLGIIEKEKPESAIIFCNTKKYTEIITRRLRSHNIRCEFISGDLRQNKRLEIIEGLKKGKYRYLVATDVAARGLDVAGLSLVINYDLPAASENYVHRIGRTARAGANGRAVSFASEHDVYELAGIEKYIHRKIPSVVAASEDYAEERFVHKKQPHSMPQESELGRGVKKQISVPENTSGEARNEKHHVRTPSRSREESARFSKLPLEERMEYYKHKYDTPSSAKSHPGKTSLEKHSEANKENAGGGKGKRPKSRNRKPRNSPRGPENAAPISRAPAPDTASARNDSSFKGRGSTDKKPTDLGIKTRGSPPAPVKKDILTRIVSLFGKKS